MSLAFLHKYLRSYRGDPRLIRAIRISKYTTTQSESPASTEIAERVSGSSIKSSTIRTSVFEVPIRARSERGTAVGLSFQYSSEAE